MQDVIDTSGTWAACPPPWSLLWGARNDGHGSFRHVSAVDWFVAWADPRIPMSWIKADKPASKAWKDTQGYARNETVFLYHIAEKLLSHICLEPILAEPGRRQQFLALVSELLTWTFQEIVPPFAKTARSRRTRPDARAKRSPDPYAGVPAAPGHGAAARQLAGQPS